MTIAPRRLFAACAGCGAAWLALIPGARGQDVTAGMDLSADGGFSNNPYHTSGSSSSVFVQGRVSPEIRLRMPRSTVSLRGTVQLRRYLDNQRDYNTYSLGLNASRQLSTRASISGGVEASQTRYSLEDLIRDQENGTIELPDDGEDTALLGRNRRRYRGFANAALTLSSRMALSTSGSVTRSTYGGNSSRGTRGYSGQATLSRVLSGTARAGVFVGIAQHDYSGNRRPDTTVYSGGISGALQTSSRWDISGQIGFSRATSLGLSTRSTTGVVGNVQMCRRGELDSICGSAARKYLPTGLLGTVPQTNASVDYNRKLSERDDISGGVAFLKSGARGDLLSVGRKFLRAQVSYNHEFSPRLRMSANAFDRKLFGNGDNRSSDYGLRLGLRYRIGGLL